MSEVFISEYDYAIGCIMWIVMIISVVGNAVSLYVFWNLAKNRATILFICVAVTDLLMSLIATPYVAMNLFSTNRASFTEGSELGSSYGSAVGIFHNTCSRVSIYTMLLLSLVRCAHMYYPLQIRQYTSTNSTITIVIFIWVICTTISFFPFMFQTKYKYNPWALLYVWQVEDLFDRDGWTTAAFKATYFFVLIFPFVIPGIGIIISTGIIIPKVYMSHKMSENMGFGQNSTQNNKVDAKDISNICSDGNY
ncbi:follicle-stimulating hormone receptor-like [Bolinopsis microptera]|uniref:follicle-stimulating hormone receptor-like n=1 Tax=Bolinopsis microptera TaxID=2820187 RepID=UPI00307ADB6F